MTPPRPPNSRLRVTYSVTDTTSDSKKFRPFLIIFPKQKTVAEFIDCIREKSQMDNLCAVYLNGKKLPEDDIFDNYWAPMAIFHVTTNPDEAPEFEEYEDEDDDQMT